MDELVRILNAITSESGAKIDSKTELIMSGILDSLNIATLLTYLEQVSGREIQIGELDLNNLSTPEIIMTNFLHQEDV